MKLPTQNSQWDFHVIPGSLQVQSSVGPLTFMEVLESKRNDLVCPFSRQTFRTFGIKRSELSLTVSYLTNKQTKKELHVSRIRILPLVEAAIYCNHNIKKKKSNFLRPPKLSLWWYLSSVVYSENLLLQLQITQLIQLKDLFLSDEALF